MNNVSNFTNFGSGKNPSNNNMNNSTNMNNNIQEDNVSANNGSVFAPKKKMKGSYTRVEI
jgi:hypothetical protein